MAFRLQQHDSSLSSLLWYKSKRVPSVKILSGNHHNLAALWVLPVPSLARTRDGRVGLRNVSVRWVHLLGWGRQSRFWGVSTAARLLAFVPVPDVDGFCSCSWRHDIERTIGTATYLHRIERDDYINKAPCRFRVLSSLPLGMLILFSKLQSLWLA